MFEIDYEIPHRHDWLLAVIAYQLHILGAALGGGTALEFKHFLPGADARLFEETKTETEKKLNDQAEKSTKAWTGFFRKMGAKPIKEVREKIRLKKLAKARGAKTPPPKRKMLRSRKEL